VIGARPGLAAYAGREIVLGIRPEDFRAHGDGAVELKVNRVESLGSELMAYLDGGETGVELTARLDRSARVEEDALARLSVNLERLYFFDPESGAAIRSSGRTPWARPRSGPGPVVHPPARSRSRGVRTGR
jgi:multiple sugar transport system ATP-binding protein